MKKIIAGVLLATAVASTASAQGTCDRACLLKTADDYVAALVAHDPSKAPLAPNAKFTEQTKVMKIGEEGLWKSAISTSTTMEQKSITILKPDGTTSERPMNFNAFDLEAAHIFKIHGDKIHEIEAMGFTLPLYSKNGWNPFIK